MYDTDKSKLENKMLDTSGLVQNTDYNVKITEIENKIPSVSGLATTSALTAAENKIPDVSSSVKKTAYNINIIEIEKILVIMILINILLHQNLMIYQQRFLLLD